MYKNIGDAYFILMDINLSDRFGRKPVMVLCHVIFFAVSLATAFSENYVSFVIFRFLTGLFQQVILIFTYLTYGTVQMVKRYGDSMKMTKQK
jgi:MFS family permease